VIAFMMPMMLNYSFTSLAGLNVIMPITDRQSKLRHAIHLTGTKSIGYFAGMFVADMILFLMPLAFIICFILVCNIEGYSTAVASTILVFIGFGSSMISLTYVYSQFFDDLTKAIKCLMPAYYLSGTILPMALFALAGAIKSSGDKIALSGEGRKAHGPEMTGVEKTIGNVIFALNPLYTFFLANYSIIMSYFEEEAVKLGQHKG
jgi:hypothetical protein